MLRWSLLLMALILCRVPSRPILLSAENGSLSSSPAKHSQRGQLGSYPTRLVIYPFWRCFALTHGAKHCTRGQETEIMTDRIQMHKPRTNAELIKDHAELVESWQERRCHARDGSNVSAVQTGKLASRCSSRLRWLTEVITYVTVALSCLLP